MTTKPEKYQKSVRAFAEAGNFLTGGVNSPVRAFDCVELNPLFIASAKGSKIYDIDGNEYINYVGSWGAMILEDAHPKVIEAIGAAAKKGTSFGAPTLAETELAKGNPDFVAVAKAYGVEGFRVTRPEDVRPTLEKALTIERPVIIDCMVAEEENVYPMIPSGQTVHDTIG